MAGGMRQFDIVELTRSLTEGGSHRSLPVVASAKTGSQALITVISLGKNRHESQAPSAMRAQAP